MLFIFGLIRQGVAGKYTVREVSQCKLVLPIKDEDIPIAAYLKCVYGQDSR